MRLLVCGGRHFNDRAALYKAIAETLGWEVTDDMRTWLPPDGTVIIVGDCPTGADLIATEWAVVHQLVPQVYEADWSKFGNRRIGNPAGPIRNQRMIDEGKPDLVLAAPGGKGTEDTIRRAKKAGIKVVRLTQTVP